MNSNVKKILLAAVVISAASVAPNLFVIAQAGYASLSDLSLEFLLPSMFVVILAYGATFFFDIADLRRLMRSGALGGLLGTIGLEIIRETGFRLGAMPGELPQLMGVLLLNRFAEGPDVASNIAGWSYHFWNGIAFGVIYSVVVGRGRVWIGTIFGVFIGVGFMMSPVVVALGVGRFGAEFGWGFPVTVTLAHAAFGSLLGWFARLQNLPRSGLFHALALNRCSHAPALKID
jgi:hypothetical protein